jgi:hypothetical protein
MQTWRGHGVSFGDCAMHNQNLRAVSPESPNRIGEAAHDVVGDGARLDWVGHMVIGADEKSVTLNEASCRWR